MEIRVSLQYAGFSSVGAALCSLRIQTGDKAAGCLFMGMLFYEWLYSWICQHLLPHRKVMKIMVLY